MRPGSITVPRRHSTRIAMLGQEDPAAEQLAELSVSHTRVKRRTYRMHLRN
jgi:hypothetical protein